MWQARKSPNETEVWMEKSWNNGEISIATFDSRSSVIWRYGVGWCWESRLGAVNVEYLYFDSFWCTRHSWGMIATYSIRVGCQGDLWSWLEDGSCISLMCFYMIFVWSDSGVIRPFVLAAFFLLFLQSNQVCFLICYISPSSLLVCSRVLFDVISFRLLVGTSLPVDCSNLLSWGYLRHCWLIPFFAGPCLSRFAYCCLYTHIVMFSVSLANNQNLSQSSHARRCCLFSLHRIPRDILNRWPVRHGLEVSHGTSWACSFSSTWTPQTRLRPSLVKTIRWWGNPLGKAGAAKWGNWPWTQQVEVFVFVWILSRAPKELSSGGTINHILRQNPYIILLVNVGAPLSRQVSATSSGVPGLFHNQK